MKDPFDIVPPTMGDKAKNIQPGTSIAFPAFLGVALLAVLLAWRRNR